MPLKRRMAIAGLAALALTLIAGVAHAVSISSVGSGYWTNPASWTPAQVPAGTDDVTIATGSTNTITTNVALTVASLTIQSNGMLTHATNTTTALGERYKVVLNIAGNLTIELGGQINVDGMGYSVGSGLGKPKGSAGGSYGGIGGGSTAVAGTTYGSVTAPTNIGSGSSNEDRADRHGGGAVQLVVAGTTTVNGVISASGPEVPGGMYGGSGGSVFLTTGSLAGNGTIRADGGKATMSGGGGRVAVILTNSSDFGAVRIQAYAGTNSSSAGAGGTVYLEHTNHMAGRGKLIVDYGGIVPLYPVYPIIGAAQDPCVGFACFTLQNGVQTSSCAFSEIVLTNGGVYGLDTNDTLNIVGTTIFADPTNRSDGISVEGGTLTVPAAFAFSNYFVRIGGTNPTFQIATSLTVGTNATLIMDAPYAMTGQVTILNGGWMTHSRNNMIEPGAPARYRIDVDIAGDLDVQTGGMIHADAKGYKPNTAMSPNPSWPGLPWGQAGGSYGGRAASHADGDNGVGSTYGSITAPTHLGSGAWQETWDTRFGGGAIRLGVSGTTTVNGVISSSGGTGAYFWGGSGGSLLLRTGALAGSGIIRANGADAVAGPGGGGRVAVFLTNSADFGNVKMQALGGSSTYPAAAGTVYTETPAQGSGKGTLLIDASNLVSYATITTLISSNVTDTVVGTVVITNKAKLQMDTNQSLTVNGSWLRGTNTSFIAGSNSTVIFASADAATVTGTNTFYNLTAGAAGKTILFEAGKTNTVNGMLIFQKNTTLLSTTDGSQWGLNLAIPGGTQQVSRVTVKDSNAGGGQKIYAGVGSLNLLNNVNWVFPPGGTIFVVR